MPSTSLSLSYSAVILHNERNYSIAMISHHKLCFIRLRINDSANNLAAFGTNGTRRDHHTTPTRNIFGQFTFKTETPCSTAVIEVLLNVGKLKKNIDIRNKLFKNNFPFLRTVLVFGRSYRNLSLKSSGTVVEEQSRIGADEDVVVETSIDACH